MTWSQGQWAFSCPRTRKAWIQTGEKSQEGWAAEAGLRELLTQRTLSGQESDDGAEKGAQNSGPRSSFQGWGPSLHRAQPCPDGETGAVLTDVSAETSDVRGSCPFTPGPFADPIALSESLSRGRHRGQLGACPASMDVEACPMMDGPGQCRPRWGRPLCCSQTCTPP